ncbi:MAG: alpha/beta hydrolase [Actinomycetota bacterium]
MWSAWLRCSRPIGDAPSSPIAVLAALVALIIAAGCSSTGGSADGDDAASDAAPPTTEATASSPSSTSSSAPSTGPASAADDAASASTGAPGPGAAERAAGADGVTPLDCPTQLPAYVEDRLPGGATGERLTCWALPTTEDPADPDSRPIDVTFYIWSGRDPELRQADPIVYLPGGPRGSAFNSLIPFTTTNIQGDRDLILVDTRGNSPIPGDDRGLVASGCPELYDTAIEIFSVNESVEAEYRRLLDGWAACLDRLRGDGWDLDQYNTPRIIGDLELLRTELGYDEWNIYGESYSTRYMLHYLDAHPTSVRSAVLDSVTPPRASAWSPAGVGQAVDAVYRLLVDGCAAAERCAGLVPDVDAELTEVRRLLDETPLEAEITHPLTGAPATLSLDGTDAAFAVGELLTPDALPGLPAIVASVAAGNTGLLGSQAGQLLGIADGGLGLSAATVCHDFGADPDLVMGDVASVLAAPEPWRQLGYISNMPCEIAGITPAPVEFLEPVVSDVPVLVVIGLLDDATPPADGRLAADTLSAATVIEFASEGHVPVRTDQCARQVVVDYWTDGADVDTACVDAANRTPFSFDP